jgi:hypothetical protein
VTSIGNEAFYDCIGLTSITIPASVTSIGDSAFFRCTGLTEINYNATAAGDFTSASYVFFSAGTYRTGITVNVGANVTKLPAYMFFVNDSSYRPKITSVHFAAGSALTSIGNSAFSYCSGITSITVPASVTRIGFSAFNNCSGLAVINYRGSEAEWNNIPKGSNWNSNCPAVIVYDYED